MLPPFLILFLSFLSSFISTTKATLVNVPVDDSLPNQVSEEAITYQSSTVWKVGHHCADCSALVNPRNEYFPANSNLPPIGPLTVSFTFTGSAIYVYYALALSTTDLTEYSNMTFHIDGERMGHFERIPQGIRGYEYNVPVYTNTALSDRKHELVIQNGQFGNAGNKSLMLFNYLVYSYDDGSEMPGSPSTSVLTMTTRGLSFSTIRTVYATYSASVHTLATLSTVSSASPTSSVEMPETTASLSSATSSTSGSTSTPDPTPSNSGASKQAKAGGLLAGVMALTIGLLLV